MRQVLLYSVLFLFVITVTHAQDSTDISKKSEISDKAVEAPDKKKSAIQVEKPVEQPVEDKADTTKKESESENTKTVISGETEQDSIVEEESDEIVDTDITDSSGTLTISTIPDSVFVFLDDSLKGRSPITIENIPLGKHTIVLKKKGHFLKKATVNITAGTDSKVSFELVKPANLSITSEPARAIVMINDKKKGESPYSINTLKPGQYSLELLHKGYEKAQRTVDLKSGGTDSIHIVMTPITKTTSDTVATQQRDTSSTDEVVDKSEKDKSKLASILDKFALGIFVAFSLIILIIELQQND